VPLEKIVNPLHPLVILAGKINWDRFEKELGSRFCETNGAPAKPIRLMVGLHYLKHAYRLSDEKTVEGWVENPYWQHFSGMKYFMHQAPVDPSLMARWRKMLGDGGMEKLLAGTVEVGFGMEVIAGRSLENVDIDATVQEKAITNLPHRRQAFPRHAQEVD
jgi:IS5 family transposase